MRVTVTTAVTHACPFVPETDVGIITVSWTDVIVELHELAAYIASYADVQITHEAMTEQVAGHVRNLGAGDVHVQTRWRTAGLDVVVDA